MNTEQFIVNNGQGYFSGHKSGGRASWKPKFKLQFSTNPEEATVFDRSGAANLQANLFLLGCGASDILPAPIAPLNPKK